MVGVTDSDDAVLRLRRLDSSAVSDALDRLGLVGVSTSLRPMWGSPRIAGRAVVVRLVPDDGSASDRHLCTRAIAGSGSGNVIVVDNAGRTEMGGWGGLLSRAAAQRDVAGVLVDGATRDVDEAREIGFPVFARAATPRTARGRVREVDAEVIALDGMPVRDGDLVIADGTGVVVIGRLAEAEVLAEAERIAAREAEIAERIAAGVPATEAMGSGYERLLDGGATAD